MKFIVFFVLALTAVGAEVEIEEGSDIRITRSLNVGSISSADRVLFSAILTSGPFSGVVSYTRGVPLNTRITAIRGWERGLLQTTTARVVNGGVGTSFVTLEFWNPNGRAFEYGLELWGR